MTIYFRLLLLAALGLPVATWAQARPDLADTTRTEPDQELDDFSGRFNGTHIFSTRIRGVRAAHGTVYRVNDDNRQLSAYQAGRLLWVTNVAAPFKSEIPTAHIASVTLASTIIFVNLGVRGMAEINRKTGRIVARYFDRDANHLVAD